MRIVMAVMGVLLAGMPALAAEPIRIGFPMILSGDGAVMGSPLLTGARMYVDEANAAGGVLGRKLELVPVDTGGSAARAGDVARALVVERKVHFLAGTFVSPEGLRVSEVARELKTVFLALSPKADSLTAPGRLHPFVFRVASNTSTEARSAASLMARWGVKRIALMTVDQTYGHEAATAFKARIRELIPDAEFVDEQLPALNERDYTPYVKAQMAAKPEAVFATLCCGNFPTFVKQATPLGYFDQLTNIVAAAEAGSVETRRALGTAYPVGLWGNAYDAEGWDGDAWVNGDVHEAYVARLKAYTGEEEPPSWASQGYIGMQFLATAIAKAGSTDADKVIAALEGMELMTPAGVMTMRAKDHQLTRGQVWGQAELLPGRPFATLKAIEYIDPTLFMD